MAQKERVISTVRSWVAGHSLTVTVPLALCQELNLNAGDRFLVRLDRYGRIIYEPIGGIAG
jgi:antitoxin component of MazEF toxin-antitoxin module